MNSIFSILFTLVCFSNVCYPSLLEKRFQDNDHYTQIDSLEEDSISTLEVSCLLNGMVNVQKTLPQVNVALHFSTTNNFTQKAISAGLKKAYLQKETVAQLAKAAQLLKERHPEYQFLILDAAQSFSHQKIIYNAASQLGQSVAFNHLPSPKKPSEKAYGIALDITLVDSLGQPLDMGSNYFEFHQKVQPKLEAKLMKKGTLTPEQLKNRLLLRSVMTEAGFVQNETKWWQFEAMTKNAASKKYPVLE